MKSTKIKNVTHAERSLQLQENYKNYKLQKNVYDYVTVCLTKLMTDGAIILTSLRGKVVSTLYS